MQAPVKRVVMPFARFGLLIATSAAALIAMAPASGHAADKDAPATAIVQVAKATKACFADVIRVNGYLMPRSEAMVSLDMEGYQITETLAREGERVSVNQVLARATRLPGEGQGQPPPPAGTPAPPTTIVLRAPAAGLIIRSTVTNGAVMSARSQPMFMIAVNGELELDGDIPSVHVAKIKVGQAARVETALRTDVAGKVRRVPAEINQITQLGHVRISLEADPSLRLGAFARGSIDAARSCGISVPRSAVLNRTDGTSVLVVRNGVVQTQKVKPGILADTTVEIREGLVENELVVAHAGASLRDGDKVSTVVVEEN
jgi:multidrug efflux pump subunit AcrA (membrane-fusion protein)